MNIKKKYITTLFLLVMVFVGVSGCRNILIDFDEEDSTLISNVVDSFATSFEEEDIDKLRSTIAPSGPITIISTVDELEPHVSEYTEREEYLSSIESDFQVAEVYEHNITDYTITIENTTARVVGDYYMEFYHDYSEMTLNGNIKISLVKVNRKWYINKYEVISESGLVY